MNCHAVPRREAGFSLAEMLVALAVTGLVALVLATGIARIGQAARRSATVESNAARVAQAQVRLRQQIERAMPLSDPQNPGSAVDFRGTAAMAEWIGAPGDAAAPDAAWRYRLARGADGTVALYHRNSLDPGAADRAPSLAGWQAEPLLGDTAGLELSYFGPAGGSAPGWQDGWTARANLPLLVRIAVRFPAGDRRVWPDLLIRPRAAAATPCPPLAPADACGDRT